jgi:hypothetical protein
MEFAPTVVNTLAGGSGALNGVIAEDSRVGASNWGSAIGEEGTGPSTLLFNMSLVIFDERRGLALRMNAAVRSLPLAIAMADWLKAFISNSMVIGCSGGLLNAPWSASRRFRSLMAFMMALVISSKVILPSATSRAASPRRERISYPSVLSNGSW